MPRWLAQHRGECRIVQSFKKKSLMPYRWYASGTQRSRLLCPVHLPRIRLFSVSSTSQKRDVDSRRKELSRGFSTAMIGSGCDHSLADAEKRRMRCGLYAPVESRSPFSGAMRVVDSLIAQTLFLGRWRRRSETIILKCLTTSPEPRHYIDDRGR